MSQPELDQPDLHQKVAQHEGDIFALYEISTRIESAVGVLDAKFDGLDRRVGVLDAKFDRLDERVGVLDRKVDALDVRLTGRMDALDAKFDVMGGQLAEVLRRLEPR